MRIEFAELRGGTWASIREFGVYPEKVESDYYAVTYKYRLRWNDVVYEPGELKAVAYKDGKKIGQTVMRTAGKPAAIRLTPDRGYLAATGEDLCYILVEALDDKGTLCPLANNSVRFEVEGPAEIALVGDLTENAAEQCQSLLDVEPGGECILYFDSPGGSAYAAIALTSLILLIILQSSNLLREICIKKD